MHPAERFGTGPGDSPGRQTTAGPRVVAGLLLATGLGPAVMAVLVGHQFPGAVIVATRYSPTMTESLAAATTGPVQRAAPIRLSSLGFDSSRSGTVLLARIVGVGRGGGVGFSCKDSVEGLVGTQFDSCGLCR